MSSKIYGHRGASLHFPENTMQAFAEAIRLGVDGVEIDVQRSKDGVLVVIHDEDLTRLSGSGGLVKDLTWQELRMRNVASHRNQEAVMPTLDEVLAFFSEHEVELNIELKNSVFPLPSLEEDVIALVNSHNMSDKVIYSSFNHLSVKRLVDLGQGDQSALLFSEWLYRPWDYAGAIGCKALHPSYNVLQYPNLVAICQENDIAVRTWTVDLAAHIDLVLALKPDALMTNDPALALARRAALEENV